MRITAKSRKIKAQRHSARHPDTGKFVKVSTNGNGNGSRMTVPLGNGLQRIIRPQARYNWLMPNVAAITPQFIEMVMNGALMGNQVQQWELFDIMLRTWPELSQCYQELKVGVTRKKLIFEPAHEEDEKPTDSAIERMKTVSDALLGMTPDAEHDGCDVNGTIENILDAWFRGASVSEIVWETRDATGGMIMAPASTYWVHPVSYAFTPDNTIGLRPQNQQPTAGGVWPFSSTTAQPFPYKLDPFPANKFLVAVHKAKTGFPLGGPMLTPLAWWWCAANFSSDWLLNLAQVFGLPFRWANYAVNAPQDTVDAICTMLQNMGSAGWAAFPEGTTLEMKEPGGRGSDHSPQGELLDRADRYCRNLILGQTMTGTHGTTGKGGGQAFGKIEKDVKEDRIDAAGKFATGVINHQLINMVMLLNYGNTDEAPTMKFLEDEVADLTEAQRDKTLADAGLIIGMDYLRKKYGIPEPAADEETIGGAKPASNFGGFGGSFGQDQPSAQPGDTGEPPTDMKARDYVALLKASDQPGHPFRGNQWVRLGDTVQTPHGKGTVVATDFTHAHVSVNGTIHKVARTDMTKIPHDKSNFPSLLQSEENKRRAQLNAKLEELNAIEDDAVFASKLTELADEIAS